MLDHTTMKRVLEELGLTSVNDYVRSVNHYGWTDFSFNVASNILEDDSKYVISSSFNVGKNQNANILVFPSLKDIVEEVRERFINRRSEGGFDLERNRIYCRFTGDSKMRFGNKSGNSFSIQLKTATLYSLVRKTNYSLNMKHTEIQWHLIVLGTALGYSVKVAKNDLNRVFNGNKLGSFGTLTLDELALPELVSEVSKRKIDLIDIIWVDKQSNRIIAAFEVELSNNYVAAVHRLAELKFNYQGSFTPVLVGSAENYHLMVQFGLLQSSQRLLPSEELKYLSINRLIDLLRFHDEFHRYTNGLRDLFLSYLQGLNKPIILL